MRGFRCLIDSFLIAATVSVRSSSGGAAASRPPIDEERGAHRARGCSSS